MIRFRTDKKALEKVHTSYMLNDHQINKRKKYIANYNHLKMHKKLHKLCVQDGSHIYTIDYLIVTIEELSDLLLTAQKTRIEVYEQYSRR